MQTYTQTHTHSVLACQHQSYSCGPKPPQQFARLQADGAHSREKEAWEQLGKLYQDRGESPQVAVDPQLGLGV